MTRHILLILFRLAALWLIILSITSLITSLPTILDSGVFTLIWIMAGYMIGLLLLAWCLLSIAPKMADWLAREPDDLEASSSWTPERVERLIVTTAGLILGVRGVEQLIHLFSQSYHFHLEDYPLSEQPAIEYSIALVVMHFLCGFLLIQKAPGVAAWIRRRCEGPSSS